MWNEDYWDDTERKTMEVIDNGVVWPIGFVWFTKPRYRVRVKGVKYDSGESKRDRAD